MTDLAPAPSKSGSDANKNQLVLLGVLAAVLVIALVFFVLKPFGGSGTPASTAPPVTAPVVAPSDASATVGGSGAESASPEVTTPAPRNRNPFQGP